MKNELFAGLVAGAALVSLTAGSARADAVADFYAGKTITIVCPIGAGGTYDFYGREGMSLVRRHPFLFLRMQVRQTAYVLLAPAQVLVVHLLTGVELRTSPFGDLLRLTPGDYARTWIVGRPALLGAFLYEMAFLVVLYVCALYGIWRAFRGSRARLVSHLFACGVIVYMIALSAGPEAHSRFRVPFMPLLALYAGLGLSALPMIAARRVGSSRFRR